MTPSRRLLSSLLAVSMIGTICIAEAMPSTVCATDASLMTTAETTVEIKLKATPLPSAEITLGNEATEEDVDIFAEGIAVAQEKAAAEEEAIRKAEEEAARKAAEAEAKRKAEAEAQKSAAAAALASGMSGGTVSGSAAQVLAFAESLIGTPYASAGASPSGFDCSGFTMYVYSNFGYSLPHSATGQLSYGSVVDVNDLQPGDLVFFGNNGAASTRASHVGIYVGGGQFIHSSSPSSGGVIISSIQSNYWSYRFFAARRII